jgi:FHA domain-containing protein
MIRIEVTHYNGDRLPQPLFAEFGESGGNIGRAEGNALVLHDPTRTISRIHASITCRGGDYSIRSLGTAIPVYVKGQMLGNGREANITAGDEIRIGSYAMKVMEAESPDFGGVSGPSTRPKDDPLAQFEGQPGRNPLDDLLAPSSNLHQQSRPMPTVSEGNFAKRGPVPIIPTDFDPFAPAPPLPHSEPERARSPEPRDVLDLGTGPSIPGESIDQLFDLGPEKGSKLFPRGSFSELMPPLEEPGTASTDPLVAIRAAAERKPSAVPTQRDNVDELRTAFRPPEAKPDTAAMRSVPPSEQQPPGMPVSEPYLSWKNKESDQGADQIISVIVPSPAQDRRKGERRRVEQQSPPPPSTESTPQKNIAPEAEIPELRAALASGSVPDREKLLGAFLSGAGVPDLGPSSGLTPEFMEVLGHLLRQSTQGTLDLLRARMLTRREIHAELTMIAPRENNPLKFSPTVEAALAHLLSPQGHGFMTPRQAMQDAYDDLRSHQFGFLAGVRAALAAVLERFSPEELERRLTQKTVIDTLLPINRKAKLWDLFAERYKEISHEAEEDFHALFGKEFLRAYEAQIAKLEQDER